MAGVRARHKEALDQLENNERTDIQEGCVYVISNGAWPGWVKIGSAIDAASRLRSYFTGSPHRDYVLHGYVYTTQRMKLERLVHESLGAVESKKEWFFMHPQDALWAIHQEGKKFNLTLPQEEASC